MTMSSGTNKRAYSTPDNTNNLGRLRSSTPLEIESNNAEIEDPTLSQSLQTRLVKSATTT
jgi:hypothetical protein